MDRINCIILDDEKLAIERLANLIDKNNKMNLCAKTTDPELITDLVAQHNPDILFIDVEMPRKTGFDVVTEIRGAGFNPTFIFVTAYDQYAIKAIRAKAFDYLLKPVDIDELNAAIERYLQQKNKRKTISIPASFIEETGLTQRETEILQLLMQGKTSKEIAEQLFVSKLTVDTHRRHILEKTNFKNTTELIEHLLKNSR